MSLHTLNDWDAAVELFNGTVVHAYQNGDQFGTDKCIFAAKTGAETWNYPVVQPSFAVNVADGVDVVDAVADEAYKTNAGDIVTRELGVDAVLKDVRLLPLDQIEVRPELRLPDNYAKMLGRSLAEGKCIRLLGLLANAAGGNLTGGVEQMIEIDVSPTDGDVGAQLKAALNSVAASMDEDGIPAEGRHVMMRSTYWYELLGVEGIFTKEYGGQANVQAPGEFISYANFAIHNGKCGFGTDYTASPWDDRMPAKYRANTTNLVFVAWHEEAWALRHWVEPIVLNDWVAMRNSYKLEARLTMGATYIQDVGIWGADALGTGV